MAPKRRAASNSTSDAMGSSSGRNGPPTSKKVKAEMTRKHDTSKSAESKRTAPALPKGRADDLGDGSSPRESNARTTAGKDGIAKESSAIATDGVPKRNKKGELVFPNFPHFRPNLTPKEVMQMGSFGGTYFRPIKSSVTGKSYRDVWKEFPADWFEGLDVQQQVASPTYRNSVNTYGVRCGGDLDMWESSGWMRPCDPYGWFQWYCRFYLGRRCDDDERQIMRGLNVFGPTGRWRRRLCNLILQKSTDVDDFTVSPKVRQILQHWGYKLTESDLEAFKKKQGSRKT